MKKFNNVKNKMLKLYKNCMRKKEALQRVLRLIKIEILKMNRIAFFQEDNSISLSENKRRLL